MTVPNKITITRLFLTPVIFFTWYSAFELALYPQLGIVLLWILFCLSELTDFLDGNIARNKNLVSDIGKLMDPFSDVFLRITYFVCFVGSGLMPVWTLAVIIWRELSIMFIRMLLFREGKTLAANMGGKLKAVLYFLSGSGGLFGLTLRAWYPKITWLSIAEKIIALAFILSALASLISFVSYLRLYFHSETHKKFMSE